MFHLLRACRTFRQSPTATTTIAHCLPVIAQNRLHLHTCLTFNAKLFIDHENRYAHRILQSHDHYHVVRRAAQEPPASTSSLNDSRLDDLLKTLPADYSTLSDTDLVARFENITQLCQRRNLCISASQFDAFVDAFCARCSDFDDDHLLQALGHLTHIPETPSLNTRNFLELWKVLDDVCCERVQSWTTERCLLVCDHWYLLHLGKVNNFNWNAMKKLGRKVRKMPANHLVQTMFYTNLLRSPTADMIDFEMNMVKCVDRMRLDEIAVMCMGFFKTQTHLRSPALLQTIYERLELEIAAVPDISLVNILKTLRYSSRLSQTAQMQKLLTALVPQVPRLSLLSCLHVLQLGSDILLCHRPAIEACLQRFAAAPIAEIRLKDMERVAFVIGVFNYSSPSAVSDVLSERFLGELKQRVPEIMRYPRCLPMCLQFLSWRGWADAELIEQTLSEEYCKVAYGRNVMLGRELFGLDSYTKIELRGTYKGAGLAEKRRRQMGISLVHYIPARESGHKLSATDRILLEMQEAVEREYGACRLAHVLPHYDRPGKKVHKHGRQKPQ